MVHNEKAPRILVVDDTPQNLMILELILSREGFEVISATDGPSARLLALDNEIDLILMDVMMPGESGFETCVKLKSNAKTHSIPIIFVSALGDSTNKVSGLEAGGVDYITKPYDRAEVLARVRVHIKLGRAYQLLIQNQLEQVRKIGQAQRALLVQPSDFPSGNFVVHYQSLQEAGGDFYDVLPLGPGISGYFVADIAGHELQNSLLTSALRALLRSNSGALYAHQETLRVINDVLLEMLHGGQHLTAIYLSVNRHKSRATVVLAGHPPLIFVPKDGEPREIGKNGDVLGAFTEVFHSPVEEPISSGDRFFLYTDGLVERLTLGVSLEEGLKKLKASLFSHKDKTLSDCLASVLNDLGLENADDDQILLGVEV